MGDFIFHGLVDNGHGHRAVPTPQTDLHAFSLDGLNVGVGRFGRVTLRIDKNDFQLIVTDLVAGLIQPHQQTILDTVAGFGGRAGKRSHQPHLENLFRAGIHGRK